MRDSATYNKKIVFLLIFMISVNSFSQSLTLTPNECFFSPKGTLKLFGKTVVTDPYNNNVHYERIGNWRNLTDTIVWGLKNVQPGTLTVELFAGIAAAENDRTVTIYLDTLEQDLQVTSTSNLQDFQSQGSVTFNVTEPGTHEVKIRIKTHTYTSNFGEIQKLVLTGTALEGAEIWKRRWRPSAIHADFISNNDVNTEITVYEMTIPTSQFWSYQVMTTEFGYVGSPILDSLFSELNFSLWSYDADAPEPPHDELSHLVAVAGEGNYFGQYGHEGTGVKPRGFNPFEGIKTDTYTLAVRKQPGIKYNTFWCYYLDPFTGHWELYGCGKKLNIDSPPQYMKSTGGFVEVVGAPDVSRTGHRQRVVEYRGWRMQNDKTWDVIERIDAAYNSDTKISYKEWTQTAAGDKFILKMGGFLDSGKDPGIIQLRNPSSLPYYLQGKYVDELYKMPATFNVLKPEYVNDSTVLLKYHVEDPGTNPEMTLYYGKQYGLTEGIFADKQIDPFWENSKDVPLTSLVNDTLQIRLEDLSTEDDYYYRLRIKNDEGIIWAFDTDTFNLSVLSGIELPELDNTRIRIFPNPAENLLRVETAYNINIERITILNSTGSKIYSKQRPATFSYDMSNLSTGIYFVVVEVNGYKKRIQKILKE